ncbi:hypothetical protein [Streptomyces sp. NPDC057052]|uniref:hypothetical protein n=1 Tax=Streptomyces sp. NPDC057052 TaxID=3346010 RepID=UPI00362FB169
MTGCPVGQGVRGRDKGGACLSLLLSCDPAWSPSARTGRHRIGPDLAAAFGARFGKEVVFEPITPERFRGSVAPLIGEGPAADVAGAYAAMGTLADRSITPENSARKLLGLGPVLV